MNDRMLCPVGESTEGVGGLTRCERADTWTDPDRSALGSDPSIKRATSLPGGSAALHVMCGGLEDNDD